MSSLDMVNVRKEPKVSVIVVNYNGIQFIDNCLRSLLNQSYQNYEIIFIDNASNDGSFDYAKSNFKQVKVFQTSKNIGYFGGALVGVENSNGDYLAFLNTDIEVDKKWLEKLVNALNSNEKVALATSKILNLDDKNIINTCGTDIQYTCLSFCRGNSLNRKYYNHIEKISAISGCSFITSRKILKEIGNLDYNFFMYLEDVDLSCRVLQAGYDIVFVPDSIVYHKYSFKFPPKKMYYVERNRYMILLKNLHFKTILIMIPSLILTEIVTWGYAISRGKEYIKSKIKAYYFTFKNLKKILEKRKSTQKFRKVKDKVVISKFMPTPKFEILIADQHKRIIIERIFNPIYKILYKITLKLL